MNNTTSVYWLDWRLVSNRLPLCAVALTFNLNSSVFCSLLQACYPYFFVFQHEWHGVIYLHKERYGICLFVCLSVSLYSNFDRKFYQRCVLGQESFRQILEVIRTSVPDSGSRLVSPWWSWWRSIFCAFPVLSLWSENIWLLSFACEMNVKPGVVSQGAVITGFCPRK